MYVFFIYVLDFVCASDISSGIYWKYAFFYCDIFISKIFWKNKMYFLIFTRAFIWSVSTCLKMQQKKYTASEFQIKSLFSISWSSFHFPVNETTVMVSTVWITKYYKIQKVFFFKK